MCGLIALVISLDRQFPNHDLPTFGDLKAIHDQCYLQQVNNLKGGSLGHKNIDQAEIDKIVRDSYLSPDQLAHVLHEWARCAGYKFRLMVLRPKTVPLPTLSIWDNDEPDLKTLWIFHDDINHYSGVQFNTDASTEHCDGEGEDDSNSGDGKCFSECQDSGTDDDASNDLTQDEYLSEYQDSGSECGPDDEVPPWLYLMNHAAIEADFDDHKCSKCGKQLLSDLQILEHIEEEHGGFMKCSWNGCSFRSSSTLIMRMHWGSDHLRLPDVFFCRWLGCDWGFRCPNGLEDHMVRSHFDSHDGLWCQWLGCKRSEKFASWKDLQEHVHRKHPQLQLECLDKECWLSFGNLESYLNHIARHGLECPYLPKGRANHSNPAAIGARDRQHPLADTETRPTGITTSRDNDLNRVQDSQISESQQSRTPTGEGSSATKQNRGDDGAVYVCDLEPCVYLEPRQRFKTEKEINLHQRTQHGENAGRRPRRNQSGTKEPADRVNAPRSHHKKDSGKSPDVGQGCSGPYFCKFPGCWAEYSHHPFSTLSAAYKHIFIHGDRCCHHPDCNGARIYGNIGQHMLSHEETKPCPEPGCPVELPRFPLERHRFEVHHHNANANIAPRSNVMGIPDPAPPSTDLTGNDAEEGCMDSIHWEEEEEEEEEVESEDKSTRCELPLSEAILEACRMRLRSLGPEARPGGESNAIFLRNLTMLSE